MTEVKLSTQEMVVEMCRAVRADLTGFSTSGKANRNVTPEVIDLTISAMEDAIIAIFAKADLASSNVDKAAVQALAMASLASVSIAYQGFVAANSFKLSSNDSWRAAMRLFLESTRVGAEHVLNQLVVNLQAKDAELAKQQGANNVN